MRTLTKLTDEEEGLKAGEATGAGAESVGGEDGIPGGRRLKAGDKPKPKDSDEIGTILPTTAGKPEERPPPTELPDRGICLHGTLRRSKACDCLTGRWFEKGLSEKVLYPFTYEHKKCGISATFPDSDFALCGRYVDVGNGCLTVVERGCTRENTEHDVELDFCLNNEDYLNVKGRGSNAFGHYDLLGTVKRDGDVTLFRHYQPHEDEVKAAERKRKSPEPSEAAALPSFQHKSPKVSNEVTRPKAISEANIVYEVGEQILAWDNLYLYDAKVLKKKDVDGEVQYLVHFLGDDRWVQPKDMKKKAPSSLNSRGWLGGGTKAANDKRKRGAGLLPASRKKVPRKASDDNHKYVIGDHVEAWDKDQLLWCKAKVRKEMSSHGLVKYMVDLDEDSSVSSGSCVANRWLPPKDVRRINPSSTGLGSKTVNSDKQKCIGGVLPGSFNQAGKVPKKARAKGKNNAKASSKNSIKNYMRPVKPSEGLSAKLTPVASQQETMRQSSTPETNNDLSSYDMMFTHILMRYLEKHNMHNMHSLALAAIGEPGSMVILRSIVGEKYWKMVHDHLDHLMKQKEMPGQLLAMPNSQSEQTITTAGAPPKHFSTQAQGELQNDSVVSQQGEQTGHSEHQNNVEQGGIVANKEGQPGQNDATYTIKQEEINDEDANIPIVEHASVSVSIKEEPSEDDDDDLEYCHFQIIVSGKESKDVIKDAIVLPRRPDMSFKRLRDEINAEEVKLPFASFRFLLAENGPLSLNRMQEMNWKKYSIWRYLTKKGDGSVSNPYHVFIEEEK